jgi:predicted AAA+ superfamily ATPase
LKKRIKMIVFQGKHSNNSIMIARTAAFTAVKNALENNPVVTLLGARQVGKTTLARQIAAEASASMPVHFFDLEDPTDLARLNEPKLALSVLAGLVIIDEVQRMPSLFPLLRVLADRPEAPAKFILLGSASPDIVRGSSETLAGRSAFIDLGGFDLREIAAAQMRPLWWRGGFPRAFLAASDTAAREWQENFIRAFLERDIPALGIDAPAPTLRRFWTMLAHYHGQTWNAAEFARSLGASEAVARRYLDILCGAFAARQLPPWFENLGKRQVKSPKVYIRDPGIMHALLRVESFEALQGHPKLGASWEGLCVEQLLAVAGERNAYYWATHAGAELDLLLFRGQKRIGVEIKYADAPRTTKSMHSALADLGLAHLYVVHPGEARFPMAENITAISLPGLIAEIA